MPAFYSLKFGWRMTLYITSAFLAALFLFLGCISITWAAFGDCGPGYRFDPRSGVGCVQANCNEVASAHYSYEGYCVCGSSGSMTENPADPNKECSSPRENSVCPGCVYACVHFDEECPAAPTALGSEPAPATEPAADESTSQADLPVVTDSGTTAPEPAPTSADANANDQPVPAGVEAANQAASQLIDISRQLLADDAQRRTIIAQAGIGEGLANAVKRGFGVMMEMLGWGTEKAFDVKIIPTENDANSGWSGLFVTPSGDYVDVKIFEGKLSFNWDDGVAAEFNLISIKGRPGSNSFIDGFSIGIGPGSASKDEASPSIPGTPISPNINVDNIKNWFSEGWNDVKSWWQENVPWPLGSANTPAIGGEQN